MTPEDKGLLALASLQAGILSLRTFYDENKMPDAHWVLEEWAPEMARSLLELDRYLTGKVENRREDKDTLHLLELARDLKIYNVYLSDGGYSRLNLNPEIGKPVKLDLELSLPRVLDRWDALRV